MSEKDIIVPLIKIKERSIFSLDELYKMLLYWFNVHRYDLQETEYRDNDIGGGKKNVEIKWYAEKKINDYFKFVIETSFLILGLEDVEVEQEGTKVKSNRGEIEFNIRSSIVKDFDNKWETGIMRFLRGTYDKFIIKSRIEGYEKELYEEVYAYMDEIKVFLNLHRF